MIHKECLAKVTIETKTTNYIDAWKVKLEELNGMFNTFEIDETKLEEMMSQKRSKELQNLLSPLVNDYKRYLLSNKSYKLDTSDFEVNQIFGSLICSEDVKVIVVFK